MPRIADLVTRDLMPLIYAIVRAVGTPQRTGQVHARLNLLRPVTLATLNSALRRMVEDGWLSVEARGHRNWYTSRDLDDDWLWSRLPSRWLQIMRLLWEREPQRGADLFRAIGEREEAHYQSPTLRVMRERGLVALYTTYSLGANLAEMVVTPEQQALVQFLRDYPQAPRDIVLTGASAVLGTECTTNALSEVLDRLIADGVVRLRVHTGVHVARIGERELLAHIRAAVSGPSDLPQEVIVPDIRRPGSMLRAEPSRPETSTTPAGKVTPSTSVTQTSEGSPTAEAELSEAPTRPHYGMPSTAPQLGLSIGRLRQHVIALLIQANRPMMTGEIVDLVTASRPLRYTTVMTVLHRLARDGWIDRHRPAGSRSDLYTCCPLTPDTALKFLPDRWRDILELFWSCGPLSTHDLVLKLNTPYPVINSAHHMMRKRGFICEAVRYELSPYGTIGDLTDDLDWSIVTLVRRRPDLRHAELLDELLAAHPGQTHHRIVPTLYRLVERQVLAPVRLARWLYDAAVTQQGLQRTLEALLTIPPAADDEFPAEDTIG
jgi:predicted transcriptional regulator